MNCQRRVLRSPGLNPFASGWHLLERTADWPSMFLSLPGRVNPLIIYLPAIENRKAWPIPNRALRIHL